LMSRCRYWRHVYLSAHEFVALPIDWELAEFFERDLGNDLDAHVSIIHLERASEFKTGGRRSLAIVPFFGIRET